eukprot:701788-Prorocentrum_minimum.AAC.1
MAVWAHQAGMYKVEQITTDYVVASSAIINGPGKEMTQEQHREDAETMVRLGLNMVALSQEVRPL